MNGQDLLGGGGTATTAPAPTGDPLRQASQQKLAQILSSIMASRKQLPQMVPTTSPQDMQRQPFNRQVAHTHDEGMQMFFQNVGAAVQNAVAAHKEKQTREAMGTWMSLQQAYERSQLTGQPLDQDPIAQAILSDPKKMKQLAKVYSTDLLNPEKTTVWHKAAERAAQADKAGKMVKTLRALHLAHQQKVQLSQQEQQQQTQELGSRVSAMGTPPDPKQAAEQAKAYYSDPRNARAILEQALGHKPTEDQVDKWLGIGPQAGSIADKVAQLKAMNIDVTPDDIKRMAGAEPKSAGFHVGWTQMENPATGKAEFAQIRTDNAGHRIGDPVFGLLPPASYLPSIRSGFVMTVVTDPDTGVQYPVQVPVTTTTTKEGITPQGGKAASTAPQKPMPSSGKPTAGAQPIAASMGLPSGSKVIGVKKMSAGVEELRKSAQIAQARLRSSEQQAKLHTNQADLLLLENYMQVSFGAAPRGIRGSPQWFKNIEDIGRGSIDDRLMGRIQSWGGKGLLDEQSRQEILESLRTEVKARQDDLQQQIHPTALPSQSQQPGTKPPGW